MKLFTRKKNKPSRECKELGVHFQTHLDGELVVQTEALVTCALMMTKLAETLPAYLDAVEDLLAHKADTLTAAADTFFEAAQAIIDASAATLAAVEHLRAGRAVTAALLAASRTFTPAVHERLVNNGVDLRKFYAGWRAQGVAARHDGCPRRHARPGAPGVTRVRRDHLV